MIRIRFGVVAPVATCAFAGGAQAADDILEGPNVSRLSLEVLSDLQISSASRRPEAVGEAAARPPRPRPTPCDWRPTCRS